MKTLKLMSSMAIITFSALTLFTNIATAEETGARKSTPKLDPVSVPLRSATNQINWPASLGSQYSDVIKSLKGEKLTAQVVGSGPQGILIIYGDNGKCKVCLGGAAACKEACSSAMSVSIDRVLTK